MKKRSAATSGPKDSPDAAPSGAAGSAPVPVEVQQAWVQFMRDDVAQSVNGLNNRLNAILAAASEIPLDKLALREREAVERIREEIFRAVNITSSLLRRVDAMAPETVPHPGPGGSLEPQPPSTILVVEDDDANRSAIARLLQRMGHFVTPTANGYEAMEILQLGPVDCIICDVRMPVLGGKGFYEQVERVMPPMASRFVFVTGDYTEPGTRNFLERSGQPVVAKPYDIGELLAAIGTVLARVHQGSDPA